MKVFIRTLVFILLLAGGQAVLAAEKPVAETQVELNEEDRELVEMLELLEIMELLNAFEDITVLEESR